MTTSNPDLARKVAEATKKLTEICDSHTEMLAVLIHVTASALSFGIEKMTRSDAEKYVVSYLMQITKLLDLDSGKPGAR